jgi:hypothetical protein
VDTNFPNEPYLKEKFMKFKVNVTDIKKGLCYDSGKCPIALAFKRKYHRSVRVGFKTLRYEKPAKGILIQQERYLSNKARQFISSFDIGKKVKPFVCEVY